MRDFKVGDIVKVYGHIDEKCRPGFQPFLYGSKAEITLITSFDCITVKTLDKLYESEVHLKQCRMFKRRKPCKKCGK
jgi:hypothetical protein